MTTPTQRPASTSDAAKRKAETEGRCWRGECRTGCYYPDVCSERAPTSAEPDADEREALRDEIAGWPIGGGYYATQIAVDEATELADAILAAGYSRTPDAHLVAAKAEAWDEGYETGRDDEIFSQRGLSTDSDADEYPHDKPYRARLREQGGEHYYLSTYCHHEQHENCRLTCKVCESACVCECHMGDE